MFKTPPNVRLLAPKVLVPGERHECELRLDVRRAIDINGVHTSFIGAEYYPSSTYNGTSVQTTTGIQNFLNSGVVLLDETTLEPGELRLPFTLPLPSGLPPTCKIDAAGVEFRYHHLVHVDIPWWPDSRLRFEASVSTVQARVNPKVARYRSASEGDGPYAELHLDSRRVVPGGRVSGSLAVFAGGDEVHLELIATIRGRGRSHVVLRRRAHFVVNADGRAEPFAFTVPADLPPTIRAFGRPHSALEWSLEMKANGRSLVRSPIEMLSEGSTLLPSEPRAGSMENAIGRTRIESLWNDVGRPLGLAMDAGSLRGSFGGCVLEAKLMMSGALAAHFTFPTTSLGLSLRGRGGKVWTGVQALAGFQLFADFHFNAADDTQAHGALELLPALRGLPLRSLSDRECRLEFPAAPTGENELRGLFERLKALALELAEWAARVPVPTGREDALPTWERIARDLSGTLQRGDLTIHRDDEELRLTLSADLNEAGLWLQVHGEWELEAEESSEDLTQAVPESLRDTFLRLCGEDEVRLSRRTFELRIDGLDAPRAEELERLRAMARLVRQLRRSVGAYR